MQIPWLVVRESIEFKQKIDFFFNITSNRTGMMISEIILFVMQAFLLPSRGKLAFNIAVCNIIFFRRNNVNMFVGMNSIHCPGIHIVS